VILAKILKKGGNLIILDEPTNDLDLATLRLLEEALVAFQGTVVAVSHDRFFLNRICTHILAFEGEGRVVYSVGSYDYYLEKRKARQVVEEETLAEPKQGSSRSTQDKPRKLKWKEKIELETIEADIQKAEAEVVRIQTLFEDPNFYKKHGDKWEEMDAQLIAAKEKVKLLYQRWEELEQIKAECV
jgi:ATP-binding cassette subfamily F protein uup